MQIYRSHKVDTKEMQPLYIIYVSFTSLNLSLLEYKVKFIHIHCFSLAPVSLYQALRNHDKPVQVRFRGIYKINLYFPHLLGIIQSSV